MNTLDHSLTDAELGERLRIARESVNKTQVEAAQLINVARTTLVAIEKGQRKLRLEELQKLAFAYGTTANSLLKKESVHLNLVPQFRKHGSVPDKSIEEASRILNKLVSAELELENVLGVTKPRNYPPERKILPGVIESQAEHDATFLRDWLMIGSGPIPDLLGVLESQLGVRIYLRKLNSKISGLFVFDDLAGACMLLNADHRMSRIKQTAAHETGHFLTRRRQSEITRLGDKVSSREEKYAECFARSLLTPLISVAERFAAITAGQSHFTRRHAILLASEFGVSREAMVRRLEELSLVKTGTWDWFESNGKISDEQVQQVLGGATSDIDRSTSFTNFGFPFRLCFLVREVYKKDMYSEGQLAQLLELDRMNIRLLLDGIEQEVSESDEQFKLLH